ncbi:hypothetical protein KCP77_08090 [Salmonella enterica subsp. enterica]|nr:hypothetical protein KCP77_08090 [Salmonella enterica subsp. enterica]
MGGNGLSGGQRQSLLLAEVTAALPNIVLPRRAAPRWTAYGRVYSAVTSVAWQPYYVVATHRVPIILELVEACHCPERGQLVMDAPKRRRLTRIGMRESPSGVEK